jgi:hypothetical protein
MRRSADLGRIVALASSPQKVSVKVNRPDMLIPGRLEVRTERTARTGTRSTGCAAAPPIKTMCPLKRKFYIFFRLCFPRAL